MVRNEYVRFGGHVDIELAMRSYDYMYQKRLRFCTIYLCFEVVLIEKNTPRTLGVNL
jgi:hypothetical protein